MIKENKVSKYVLYAIGEIVLVVIGILIALSINNWNEERRDHIKERKVLIELKKTLNRNCEVMENDIEIRDTLNRSSVIIISALQNKYSYNDSLNVHFQLARIPGALLTISKAGYEGLKNTGFDIIRTDSLRNEIIDLFEVTYSSMAVLNNYFLNFQAERQSYIDDLFFYNDKMRPLTLVPFDYELLLKDNHFLALLLSVKVQRNVITKEIINSLEESQRIIRLIDYELNEY